MTLERFGDAEVLGTFAIGSEEWLAARKLGGSTIHKLAQYERWQADPERYPVPRYTPWDVWTELTQESPREDRYIFRRGNALEPEIIAWLSRSHEGLEPYKASLRHATHHWMTSNLDAVQRVIKVIWEIKDWGLYRREQFVHGVPDDLVDQLHWQGLVVGWTNLIAGVSIGGAEPEAIPVPYDADRADFLFEVGERFWRDHVETGKPPVPDYSDACAEAMLSTWNESAPDIAPLLTDDVELVRSYRYAAEQMKRFEAEKKAARHAIMERLGDHQRLEGLGFKVSRVKGRKRLDFEALALDHSEKVDAHRTAFDEASFRRAEPVLFEQYHRTVTGGSIRITEKKEPEA